MLKTCGFYPESDINILSGKALITISKSNTIEMHDLIQEMAQEIIRKESEKNPGERSRLWDPEEVCDVLKYNRGTKAVEGMILDTSEIRNLYLGFKSFAEMANIRFLKFYFGKGSNRCNIYLPEGLDSLPNKLRYLRWDKCCLQSLPSNFHAEMLVELSMENSHLEKLWDGVQNLVNLWKIDLSCSEHLIELPNFSKATNLKFVYLNGCKSLRQVHPSILSLHKLERLFLQGCTKIESIQTDVHLKSLCELFLSNCSSLREFSVTSEKMKTLILDGTSLHEIPSSICLNKRLRNLSLHNCENLYIHGNKLYSDAGFRSLRLLILCGCKHLNVSNLCFILDGLRSLTGLVLKNCCNLQTLPESIGRLSSLEHLNLSGSNVESLSTNIKNLSKLSNLWLNNCRKLVSLPELPPFLASLSVLNCMSLGTFFTRNIIPQMLQFNMSFLPYRGFCHNGFRRFGYRYMILFPGARVPDEFVFYTTLTSITIPHLPQSNLCGFIICLLLSPLPSYGEHHSAVCSISKNGEMVGSVSSYLVSEYEVYKWSSDHVCLWFYDIYEIFGLGIPYNVADDHCNISFKFKIEQDSSGQMSAREIKGCGVYPVYDSKYPKESELMLYEFDNTIEYFEDIVELERMVKAKLELMRNKPGNLKLKLED